MKTRRVCVMLDADEATAILEALKAYVGIPYQKPVHGQTVALDAYALIASRTRALRGSPNDEIERKL